MKKIVTLFATVLLLYGCGSVPLTGRKQMLLVSDSEVLSSSLTQYSEYIKSAPISSNATKKAMVTRVGKKIAAATEQYLDNKWPITWRTFDFKMTKIPIPDNVNECESILVELVRYSFELIFSLLTITDISEEEFLQKAVQTEGTIQEIKSIRYERNPINRKLCLYKKGYTCAVCGMNFQDVYGDIGKGFIEVHHTTPVSKMGEGYNLDIERDLVPLCSNCHSMTHRRNPPYSVEELKEIIKLK